MGKYVVRAKRMMKEYNELKETVYALESKLDRVLALFEAYKSHKKNNLGHKKDNNTNKQEDLSAMVFVDNKATGHFKGYALKDMALNIQKK